MKNQCFNPFLPPWEYIPDGEPHVFNDRVYLYGSHDRASGFVFCQNDYVCWSAPLDDLSDWKYEGVIYEKTNDPYNADGHMVLYAPDVCRGPDGKYYMYYVLDKVNVVSVAVCDTPAGEYKFYGYVKYSDGTKLGEKEGDEPQFDPGLLVEGERVYLYTGFCGIGDKSRTGAMATVLDRDMLTIIENPVFVAPGNCNGNGTGFEGHEFFEAPSMRKIDDTYYLIYSSTPMTELCYATSKHPTKDFKYGGVIVSNCDLNIDTYKPAEKRIYPHGNNHGSIAKIKNQWYIFYHRMTHGTWFSRQACVEKINVKPDGTIPQVEMTSLGASHKPFDGFGTYPSYIACCLFNENGANHENRFPKITQEGVDDNYYESQNCYTCYITDIIDSTVFGYKYFDFKNAKKIDLVTRAYCRGSFEVRTSLDGKVLGSIAVVSTNIWTKFSGDVNIPDGVHALYFTYKGGGNPQLLSFSIG